MNYRVIIYLCVIQENQNKRKKKTDNNAQRNKIIKETKEIPRVVLAIETFHKDILQLSKKTGVSIFNIKIVNINITYNKKFKTRR